jgi:hypothetical protein
VVVGAVVELIVGEMVVWVLVVELIVESVTVEVTDGLVVAVLPLDGPQAVAKITNKTIDTRMRTRSVT